MTASVLVTGGTGNIGSHVVPLLARDGRDLRVLSRGGGVDTPGVRHFRGDVMTGDGVATALDGVTVVLHLAGGLKGDDVATRKLVASAAVARVEHIILISVIGAGRMPIGYFRMKDAAEQAVAESGIPWTVLRAAQLHDFVLPFVRGLVKLPLAPAPRGVNFEPVDVESVARRLADLTLAAPAGRVADIAGPEVLSIETLIKTYARALGKRRRMLRFSIPGSIGRAYRDSANLASSDVDRAGRTWQQYLDERRPSRD